GYFARRLIRRAVRLGHELGLTQPFCAEIARHVVAVYADAYPELSKARDTIDTEITKEENRFRQTLATGLRLLTQLLASDAVHSSRTLPAKETFDLYQSYGFPLEMTEEIAKEHNVTVDHEGFQKLFEAHQAGSRAGAEQKFKGGLIDHSEKSVHYHTATHLLHQALRTVLGDHVFQKGSNITPERLRFDFSHPAKMTPEQIAAVEKLINEQIAADLPVKREEMSVAEAKQRGALGLFEHKYGDTVSVYTVGNFSVEICGGPHVEHTGVLGHFKILKEESASSGVRRIKAVLTE